LVESNFNPAKFRGRPDPGAAPGVYRQWTSITFVLFPFGSASRTSGILPILIRDKTLYTRVNRFGHGIVLEAEKPRDSKSIQ
jgi:hypothetical protein